MAHASSPQVPPWQEVLPSQPRRYRAHRFEDAQPLQISRDRAPSTRQSPWFAVIAGSAMLAVLLLISYAVWDRMNYQPSSAGISANPPADVDGRVTADRAESAMLDREPWHGIDVVARAGHAVPAAPTPALPQSQPAQQ